MILSIALVVLGVALAAPFVVAILRSASIGRLVRIWMIQVIASASLWGASALIFHSGSIPREHRLVAALLIHGLWVALALAILIGAVSAIMRALQLRGHLRTSGK